MRFVLSLSLAFLLAASWALPALGDPAQDTDPAYADYFSQENNLASQGDVAAEACLSWLYGLGFGTPRDLEKMIHWASAAADAGSDEGKLDLAKAYAWGAGVEADPKKGFAMTEELATKGYAPAESSLGVLYASGTGVDKDSAKAVEWLTKAAEAGDFEGEIRLAGLYHWGEDIKADPKRSQKWLDKAALHKSDCAVEYFFQMPFLINSYITPGSLDAKEPRGRMGIQLTNKNGKAVDVVVFQPSGSHKVDDAWAKAARKAKLPPWPKALHARVKVSAFWVQGTYDGYDPDFTAALKSAIHDATLLPKDVLVHGSKGTGNATVSFDYLDGTVSNVKVTQSSDEPSEDTAAIAAVTNAKYPATPYQYAHMKIPLVVTVNFGTYTPASPTTTTAAPATAAVPAAATHQHK